MWPIYWPAGQGGCQIQHVRPNSGYASLHSEGHKQKQNRTLKVWLQCEEKTHREDISQREEELVAEALECRRKWTSKTLGTFCRCKTPSSEWGNQACSEDSRVILHKHEELNTFPHRENIRFYKTQPEKSPHLGNKYGAWKTSWQ